MSSAPVLMDEPRRLEALRRCRVLDSPPVVELDGITEAVATLCETPVALISLIDADRQWFKSSVGLELSETPRDIAFCAHAILHPAELTMVEDAHLDPRFRDNPLVQNSPYVRFYAGQPLLSKDGFALGTLCVLDYQPRTLTTAQREALQHLAGVVSVLIERQLQQELLEERARERTVELRESEERFRDFVDSAVDYCWETDASMRYTYFDEDIDKVVGIPVADVVGMDRLTVINRHWRVPRAELQVHLDDVKAHRSFRNFEVQWEGPSSEVRALVVTGKPVFDDEGVFQGYRGTVRDISELRSVEEQLQLRQSELAHAARFAAMGEMVFGLAHELNQPLAAAVNFAEAGAQLLKPGSERPDAARGAFRQVAKQIQRAGDIVQHLRSFVRSGEARSESVNVNNVVRDVLALMTYELRSERVTLVLELKEDVAAVNSDRVQLEQVVLNLVRNAVDAMKGLPGRDAKTLTIRTSSEAAYGVEVCVKDSGEGLPNEGQAKLFDPFFTTRSSGMGMGLSISRSIIEAHGGSLACCANPDRGATFYFSLPAAS